jgi:hypothetical protein
MEVLTNKVLRFISDTRFEDQPDSVAFFAEKVFLKKRIFHFVANCENSHGLSLNSS